MPMCLCTNMVRVYLLRQLSLLELAFLQLHKYGALPSNPSEGTATDCRAPTIQPTPPSVPKPPPCPSPNRPTRNSEEDFRISPLKS